MTRICGIEIKSSDAILTVLDYDDNCPVTENSDQGDLDTDNIGDVCDCEGNFDCDQDVDGADTTLFVADLGRSVWYLECTSEATCNGDFDCDGDVDGDDTTLFINDLGRSVWFDPCPACIAGDWCVYP